MRQVDYGQSLVVGRRQMNRGRAPHLSCFFPARRTKAPLIAGFQPWEPKFGARRDQVIPAIETVIQKFCRDGHADRMHALIHRARIAAAISKESSQRIMATWGECFTQHISSFGLCRAHAGTGSALFDAALSTPQ